MHLCHLAPLQGHNFKITIVVASIVILASAVAPLCLELLELSHITSYLYMHNLVPKGQNALMYLTQSLFMYLNDPKSFISHL